ncbi:MAG: type II secretion system F family protein [Alphaproteobacteria bacterium]|nr:type II secretion system F family protein [Alphaproteobacteria bacterium]
MPSFAYEAAGPDGAIGRGVIDAPNRGAAVERILALGRTPLRVVEQDTSGATGFATARLLPEFGLAADRLGLLRELGTLLQAGLGVERALLAMQGLTTRRRSKAAAQAMLEGLRAGEPLSGAMRRAGSLFAEPMRRLVAAGEASGRLPDVMTRLAVAEARNKELSDRAVSAMIYPALLVIVMIIVLAIIFTSVIPRLEPLFAQSGDALPWPAAVLLGVSQFFNAHGTLVVVALIAALGGLIYLLRQPAAQVALARWSFRSRLLLDIPRRMHAAQFGRNVAMLLNGGMPLNRALETAQAAVGNVHLKQRLSGAIELVRQGKSLKAALEASDALPRAIMEFAAIGEETGRLAPMLNEAADILDRDVQTNLDRLSALLLPAVTIVLGLVVAGIMSGVVSGILAANELAL